MLVYIRALSLRVRGPHVRHGGNKLNRASMHEVADTGISMRLLDLQSELLIDVSTLLPPFQ